MRTPTPCEIRVNLTLPIYFSRRGVASAAMSSCSLLSYLVSLPPVALERLYTDSWVAQAVVRVLSPLGRLYALRLASAGGALPKSLVSSWPKVSAGAARIEPAASSAASTRHAEALRQMRALRLLEERAGELCLSRGFGEVLRCALERGVHGMERDGDALYGVDKNAVSADELDRLGSERWEALLLAILHPPSTPLPLAIATELAPLRGEASGATTLQDLLAAAGLIEEYDSALETVDDGSDDAEGAELPICTSGNGRCWRTSHEGKSYLLEPPSSQVWRVVLAYVSLCRKISPAAHDSALSFVLRLAFLPTATNYPTGGLSTIERCALTDFANFFGLAYQRSSNSRRFYATPFAELLLQQPGTLVAAGGGGAKGASMTAKSAGGTDGNAVAGGRSASASGFVIIETNFRVYAHSSSDLAARLLRTFCHLSYQLPGLIVASLTRQSVQVGSVSSRPVHSTRSLSSACPRRMQERLREAKVYVKRHFGARSLAAPSTGSPGERVST